MKYIDSIFVFAKSLPFCKVPSLTCLRQEIASRTELVQSMEMEGTEMQEEDWEGLCEMFKARAEQKGIEMDDTALRAMAKSFVETSATILGRAKAHLRPPRALTEMAASTSGESALCVQCGCVENADTNIPPHY